MEQALKLPTKTISLLAKFMTITPLNPQNCKDFLQDVNHELWILNENKAEKSSEGTKTSSDTPKTNKTDEKASKKNENSSKKDDDKEKKDDSSDDDDDDGDNDDRGLLVPVLDILKRLIQKKPSSQPN